MLKDVSSKICLKEFYPEKYKYLFLHTGRKLCQGVVNPNGTFFFDFVNVSKDVVDRYNKHKKKFPFVGVGRVFLYVLAGRHGHKVVEQT